MGYAVSWLAVKEEKSAAILQHLGLTITGEIDDYGEALLTGGALPSGWWVLFINECEYSFVQPPSLASISAFGDVIACSIEEHVMWCKAELWRNGAQVWCVEHDAQQSLAHLHSSGSLPVEFSAIESESAQRQSEAGGRDAGVDYYFEVPLQTAKSIVGFKHDESTPGKTPFVVLKKVVGDRAPVALPETPRKPWWKRW